MASISGRVTIHRGAGDPLEIELEQENGETIGTILNQLVEGGHVEPGTRLSVGGRQADVNERLRPGDEASVVTPAGSKG